MIANKTGYWDEFWGHKIYDYEVKLEEEYDGEVFDKLKKEILASSYDDITFSNPLEVEDEYGNFYDILPYEWLTEEQMDFLEKLINLINNYIVIECGKEGKYYLLDVMKDIPENCKEIDWGEISDDYLERLINEKGNRIFKG